LTDRKGNIRSPKGTVPFGRGLGSVQPQGYCLQ